MAPPQSLSLEVAGSASVCHTPGSRSNSLRAAARSTVMESPSAEERRSGGGGYATSGATLLQEDGSGMSPTRNHTKMIRAKDWTPQVEDLYRLQFCGWRDEAEYTAIYGEPERWSSEEGGFISKIQLKTNGYFTYWRKWRECEDKHVNRVKVYS